MSLHIYLSIYLRLPLIFSFLSFFIALSIYLPLSRLIVLVYTVFANGPGNQGSILGHIIRMTLKWYLIPPCLILNNIRYVSRVKWSNPGKGVAPFSTPQCSSYWKRSIQVANFTYLLTLYIYIYIYIIRVQPNSEPNAEFNGCHLYIHTYIYIYIYIYIYMYI